MAKEDFCFTYYDGDAARDKAHMTRLERGAYDDIISAQRKRGHLSIEDIKRVLSKDFETCWSSLEWILQKDESGKYFIEWVDKSIEKMRFNSKKQKEKADKRWGKDATAMPQHNNGIDSVMPLENGNGNKNLLNSELVKETARKVFNDKIWAEATGMGHSITRDELAKWMSQFNASLVGDNISNFSESTYKKMFGGWLNKQRSKGYKLPEKQKQSTQPLQTLNG